MIETEDAVEAPAAAPATHEPSWPPRSAVTPERILEALLLAADAPLSLDVLQRVLGDPLGLARPALRELLGVLGARLATSASELVEVASGWRLQLRTEYADWIARLSEERPPRMSRAMLETLALIVYRQPITRGEIEEIRGVAVSSNILRALQERGWIRELGHKEAPGRPTLFGTTAQLLDDLGLRSLNQLPPLPEVRDLAQLEAALAQLVPGGVDKLEPESNIAPAVSEAHEPMTLGEDETAIPQLAPPPDETLH